MSALTDGLPGRYCGTCVHWRMPLIYMAHSSECLARGGRTAIAEACEQWAGSDSHLPDGLKGERVAVKRWAIP